MRKKNPKKDRQDDLFRPRLENIIDPRHELVKLAALIDWDGLESDLSRFYCSDNGRPAGSIRLMTGLCFLKDIKGLSDEEVCAVWCENPYFQHFCGETFFQHRFPVEPPSLSIFRGRIGEAGMERLLEETIKVGVQTGTVSKRDLSHVTVDTTVQEKAVHFCCSALPFGSHGRVPVPPGARGVGQAGARAEYSSAPKLPPQRQTGPVHGQPLHGGAADEAGAQEDQGS